jgi:hypothetical protein
LHNVRTWKHSGWRQEKKKNFCRTLAINKMCGGRTWKHTSWKYEQKKNLFQTFEMPNQTWEHTIEPQKPLDETWKQIGSIGRVQMRMESKITFIPNIQCA